MALLDLDRCLQHPVRVALLIALLEPGNGRTFTGLRDRFGLTDGNLNRHLKVLIDAGWVESRRTGRGRGSTTTLNLAPEGRRGLASLADWCAEVSREMGREGLQEEGHRANVPGTSGRSFPELLEDRSRVWET